LDAGYIKEESKTDSSDHQCTPNSSPKNWAVFQKLALIFGIDSILDILVLVLLPGILDIIAVDARRSTTSQLQIHPTRCQQGPCKLSAKTMHWRVPRYNNIRAPFSLVPTS
jgi:hypothetical protein